MAGRVCVSAEQAQALTGRKGVGEPEGAGPVHVWAQAEQGQATRHAGVGSWAWRGQRKSEGPKEKAGRSHNFTRRRNRTLQNEEEGLNQEGGCVATAWS